MRKMKETTPKHIIINLLKTHDKKKNLKKHVGGGWERHVIYRGTKIRILADFLLKTM